MTPYHDSYSTTDPKPEILSAVQTGNRNSCDGRNVRGTMHVHMRRKDNIFRQRRLDHSGIAGGDYGYSFPSKEFSLKWPYMSLCAIFTLVLDLISYWSVKWCQAWLAFEPAEGRRKS